MRVFVALAALCAAVPAQAEWRQASSRHFVIYSEQRPEQLRQFADELERFDEAVRILYLLPEQPVSKGNRVTIFDVGSATKVQQLIHDQSGMIAGFYRGRAGGSVAFASRTDRNDIRMTETGSIVGHSWTLAMRDNTVLFHEYAHHLMMQDIANPYPKWLAEGFAEVLATARVDRDGSVAIGLPADYRVPGLELGQQLPLETLLSDKFGKLNNEQWESIYGKGWVLTQYLTFDPSRKGQLKTYVSLLTRGVPSLDAARQAFGDIRKLEKDLDDYMDRGRVRGLNIPGPQIKIAPIEISGVSAGAAAILPVLMQLKSGAGDNPDVIAKEARAVAQIYRGDPLVETTLSDAEFDARNYVAAEAAADRALASDPNSTKAMILKGRARIENLVKAGAPAADFVDARNWFLKANKIDPENPEPLYEFYASFGRQGIAPTANAIAALHYASDLAPQDEGVRLTSAEQYLAEGKGKDARTTLIPVAYDPHGGELADLAKRMIARIDTGDTAGAMKEAERKTAAGAGS